MKYLVVSDNHGNREILVELVNNYKGSVDYMFHCGDSELLPTDELWKHFLVVRGNCDFYDEYPTMLLEETKEDKVFITHGHLFNVGVGLTKISLKAQESNATICLFGHTHQLGCEMHQHILYLNPGSISQPRGRIQLKTYAIIEHTEEGYKIDYYDEHHQVIPQLTTKFLTRI